MSLRKRGAVWWTYFYVDGIRHQVSTRTSNRRLAERIEQQLKDQAALARHRLPQADPHLTFGALAARFLATAGPRPHHIDRLKHLLPYFADVSLAALTKAHVREYRAGRHAQRALKDATINREVSVFRHLLYWAVDEGLLLHNPLTRIKFPPERRTPRPVLTVAEEAALLAVAPVHLQALIIAALDTGMRRGELLTQRWEQVDLTRQILAVTRSKTVEGEGREIPLTSRWAAWLRERHQASGPVFMYGGHAIGTIKTTWRTTLRHAGIRHVRFHDLRHTFNTRLLDAGVLQEVRKALMGHVSGAGVHGVYTHVELPLKRDAIARLEAWCAAERTRLHTEAARSSIVNPQEDSHDPAETPRSAQGDPRTGRPDPEALAQEDARRSRP